MFRCLCIALLFVAGLAANVDINDSGRAAVAANRALKQEGGLAMTTMKKASPSTKKKSPPKKSPPKKSPGKKSPGKKSPGQKSPYKKPPSPKMPAKKPPSPKMPAKKPPSPKMPAGGAGVTHTIQVGTGAGFSFSPKDSTGIKVGDTVCFKSVTGGHNVLFLAAPAGVTLASISNTAMQNADVGFKYCFKVTKAGPYKYVCGPHAGLTPPMAGTLSVS